MRTRNPEEMRESERVQTIFAMQDAIAVLRQTRPYCHLDSIEFFEKKIKELQNAKTEK